MVGLIDLIEFTWPRLWAHWAELPSALAQGVEFSVASSSLQRRAGLIRVQKVEPLLQPPVPPDLESPLPTVEGVVCAQDSCRRDMTVF